MRSAKTIVREIELTGRLIETTRLFISSEKVQINFNLMTILLKRLNQNAVRDSLGKSTHLFWRSVDSKIVADFVESFQNHPESVLTDSATVKKYVESLSEDEKINKWNVLFISVNTPAKTLNIKVFQEELKDINPGIRNTTTPCSAGIMLSQRKLGAGGIEKIDLKEGAVREIPLLMVHILDCRLNSHPDKPVFLNGVVAYGISFPGAKDGRRIKKIATYQVNTTWMNERYGDEIENDEDMGEDL